MAAAWVETWTNWASLSSSATSLSRADTTPGRCGSEWRPRPGRDAVDVTTPAGPASHHGEKLEPGGYLSYPGDEAHTFQALARGTSACSSRRTPDRYEQAHRRRRDAGTAWEMPSTSATTMGIVGDAEAVKPEHGLAMFKRRGGGDEEAASGMLQAVRRSLGDSPGDVASWHLRAIERYSRRWVTAFLDDVPPTTPDLF